MRTNSLQAPEMTIGNTQITDFSTIRRHGNNFLINGKMDIWQRGTDPFYSAEYTSDRWIQSFSGGILTTDRWQNTNWPSVYARYSLRTTVSSQSAAGDYAQIIQRIENPWEFSNQEISLSFDIYANQTGNIFLYLSNVYGSGGSSTTNVIFGKYTLTTGWNHIESTATNDDWSTKTIGSTDAYAELKLVYSAGSTYDSLTNSLGIQNGTWYLTNVKLEANEVATPFVPRLPQQELSLCQRYFYDLGGTNIIGIGSGMSSLIRLERFHPVQMRTTPTVTSNFASYRAFGVGTTTFNTVYQVDPKSCTLVFSPSDFSAVNGDSYIIDTQSISGSLEFDAEL